MNKLSEKHKIKNKILFFAYLSGSEESNNIEIIRSFAIAQDDKLVIVAVDLPNISQEKHLINGVRAYGHAKNKHLIVVQCLLYQKLH
ncbi:MAG: hypothetical protein K0Q97_352 [Bacillota bacterium]|jgi:hypothetical protein|nr:hypothetical protein [Bacillota bacterium]